ncbi:MAG: DJ-1/PfpI family protein [Clostridia bacterium]|nr:DJ-1/PfpI family protein [Clostridia bacterium]
MTVYVMLADGFEEIEGLSVVDVLRRGEVETVMVSVKEDKLVTSARNITVVADKTLEQIEIQKDDMIVLPGGQKGVQGLEASEKLTELLKKHYAENGWLAAICAGPSFPGKLGFYNGLKATCYPGFEESLTGATCVEDDVVVEKPFVTARGAGVSWAFAFTLLSIIKGPELSEKIQKAMLYKG